MTGLSETRSDQRVGVVIVNYNSGPFLRRCIDSLLETVLPLQIAVVDNHSSDTSLASIQDIESGIHRIQIIRNGGNLGFSAAVNIGREQVSVDKLLLLNPDCTLYPHTVERLLDEMATHPEAGLVGPLLFNEDGTEQRGCRRHEPTLGRSVVTALGLGKRFQGVDQTGQPMPDRAVTVDAVSGACLMIESGLFDQIGGMDEGYFLHCEDLDLCRRVRDSGRRVMFTPKVSLFHRQGGSGGAAFSMIEKRKHRGMLRYYRQHLAGDERLTAGSRHLVMRLLVWNHYLLALGIHRLNRFRDRNRAVNAEPPLVTALTDCDLVVSGANSDVGDCLLAELRRRERPCVALVRDPGAMANSGIHGVRWLASGYFDLVPDPDRPTFGQWIHLAPIWTTPHFDTMARTTGVAELVALSSTSIDAKAGSGSDQDQQIVRALGDGEEALQNLAARIDSRWVILRPTMIYGGPRNRNINLVKKLIRWSGRFPVVGDASGKRQPVHVEDVALACLLALENSAANGVYDLPGGETLSYRMMIERVFDSTGRSPKLWHISRGGARNVLGVFSKLPILSGLSPDVADRMSSDQVFNVESAANDFGYAPKPFRP